MFCGKCGNELTDEFVFCPYCGANLAEMMKKLGGSAKVADEVKNDVVPSPVENPVKIEPLAPVTPNAGSQSYASPVNSSLNDEYVKYPDNDPLYYYKKYLNGYRELVKIDGDYLVYNNQRMLLADITDLYLVDPYSYTIVDKNGQKMKVVHLSGIASLGHNEQLMAETDINLIRVAPLFGDAKMRNKCRIVAEMTLAMHRYFEDFNYKTSVEMIFGNMFKFADKLIDELEEGEEIVWAYCVESKNLTTKIFCPGFPVCLTNRRIITYDGNQVMLDEIQDIDVKFALRWGPGNSFHDLKCTLKNGQKKKLLIVYPKVKENIFEQYLRYRKEGRPEEFNRQKAGSFEGVLNKSVVV